MPFQDILNDSLTKERGGRHGGKGHEFQRYWALCHLLKLDGEHDDYLVLLEFIEDVAVLDSENSPTAMDLFQLKKNETRTGKWTKTALATPPKKGRGGENGDDEKKGKSILAKLYESRNVAKAETRSIAFVSNAPVELKLSEEEDSTARSEFCAADLDDALKISLRASIASELSCAEDEINFDDLHFIRSPLAMDDLETHATGRVSTYLAGKSPEHTARADVFCKALYSEIKIKATATEEASEFHELKRIRGISRAQFAKMVSITLARKPDADVIDNAVNALVAEGVPFLERKSIRDAARRFLVDKAGKGNAIIDLLMQEIDNLSSVLPENLVTSWEVANWIVDGILAADKSSTFSMLGREYLLAVVLYRINQ